MFPCPSYQHPHVKALRKIHPRAGSGELIKQRFPILAGKYVRIEQNNVLLPAPELLKISDLYALPAFLFADNAPRASAWASSRQESVSGVFRFRSGAVVNGIIGITMLDLVRQFVLKVISGTPPITWELFGIQSMSRE